MNKLLSILLLLCSIPVFGQIETTIEKDGYLLYDFNGKEYTKNKKIKEGTAITLLNESNSFPNFYIIRYKENLYTIKGNYINHTAIQLYQDSLLALKQKKEALARYNDSIRIAKQERRDKEIAIIKYRKDSIEKHRADSIKSIKRIFVLAAYNEIEKTKKERVKQGMPIEIAYLDTNTPNSAGGTNLEFRLKNISTKRIKYISVTGYPINAVEDKCVCTIRGYSQCTRKGVGPIEPNEYASYTWENTWYNRTIDKYIPTSIIIQYMSGGSVTISGSKLKSIMQNRLLDEILKEVLEENDIDLDKIID